MSTCLAFEQNFAVVLLVQPGQDVDQRRFAGAVVADQPQRLAPA